MLLNLVIKDKFGKLLGEIEFDSSNFFSRNPEEFVSVPSSDYDYIFENMDYGIIIFKPVNEGEDFAFKYISADFKENYSDNLKVDINEEDLFGAIFGKTFPMFKSILLNLFQEVYNENKILESIFYLYNSENNELLRVVAQKLIRYEDELFVLSKDISKEEFEKIAAENEFNNALLGLIRFNKEGYFLKANNFFKEITGYNDDELKKLRMSDLIIEFYNDNPLIKSFDDVLKFIFNGEVVISDSKLKIKTKDNGFKWIKTHSGLFNGEVVQTSATDITNNVFLENESLRFKETLDSIQDFSKVTMMIFTQGNYYWTDEVYTLFELDKNNDVNYYLFSEFLVPEDLKVILDYKNKLTPENDQFNLKVRIISAKGNLKYIDGFFKVNAFDENNEVIESVAFLQDITEKVEIENKAIKLQNNLISVQKLSKFSIVIYENGKFMWDDEIYDILEINKGDYPENVDLISKFLPEDEVINFDKDLNNLSPENPSMEFKLSFLDNKGNKKILNVNLIKKFGEKGEIRTIGFIQDVSKFEFLKESESNLFEKADQPIIILQDKKLVRVNNYFEELGLFKNSSFSSVNDFNADLLFNDDSAYDKLINGELLSYSDEVIIPHNDGSHSNLHIVAMPTSYNQHNAVQISISDITSFRNKESKILELQENLDMILDVAKEAICYKKDGLVYSTNEVYNIIEREFRESDRSTDFILELCTPDERKRIYNLLDNISPENPIAITNIKITTEKGNDKYLLMHYKYNFEENSVFEAVSILRDVTVRVLAQKELDKKSEEAITLKNNLETIQGITKLAICHWTDKIDRFNWTSEIYNILEIDEGMFADDVDLIEKFVIDEDKDLFYENRIAVTKGEIWSEVLRVKTLSGNLKYLSIYLINTLEDGFKYTVAFVQDITKLKINELKALELQNNLYEVQKISETCMSYYSEGKLYYTPNTYNILGTSEEIDPAKFIPSKYICPDDLIIVNQKLKEISKDSPNLVMNYRVKTKTGKIKYIQSIMKSEFKGNEMVNRIGVHRDMTREYEYENKLKLALNEKDSLIRDKEFLLKEVHHRVKNNLQIILSLISLDERFNSNPHLIIKNARNRINAMALLHEKIYGSESLSGIRLDKYVVSLVNSLLGLYSSNITFHSDLDEIELDMDIAIPIGLIINELINNSIKYAFPEGKKGNLFISIKSNNDLVELIVEDDGVGLGDMDIFNSPSLGFKVVNNLIAQIEGGISVLDKSGTAFKIEFKK